MLLKQVCFLFSLVHCLCLYYARVLTSSSINDTSFGFSLSPLYINEVNWMLCPFADEVCFAEDIVSGSTSPSKAKEYCSDDIISFSNVDIITPAQKMLARQLTCSITPGKSLLVTGL